MMTCEQCGASFERNKFGPRPRFCSNPCRERWHTIHNGHRGRTLELVCEGCGSTFRRKKTGRPMPRFCSFKCRSIIMRGDKAPVYKGGRIQVGPYIKVLMPDHPNAMGDGYVLEHILVMSQVIGRPIDTKHELVHHREEPKTNNDPSNLELMTRSAHQSLHMRLRRESRS